MKRCITILVWFLAMQLNYQCIPVIAQEVETTDVNYDANNQDSEGIKKVIENYLDSFARKDIDGMMVFVSKNYRDGGGRNLGYDQFKNVNKRKMKKMTDISISNLKISDIAVTGDTAVAIAEFDFKMVLLKDMRNQESILKIKKQYSLTKAAGEWKIVSINNLSSN